MKNNSNANNLYRKLSNLDYLKKSILQLLKSEPLWYVQDQKFILDTQNLLLWKNNSDGMIEYKEVNHYLTEFRNLSYPFGYDFGWTIPNIEQLQALAVKIQNESSFNGKYFLWNKRYWIIGHPYRCIDLAKGKDDEERTNGHLVFVNNSIAQNLANFIEQIINFDITLTSVKNENFNLLDYMKNPNIIDLYQNLDYNRCRLPQIETIQFTDPHKGVWELNGIDLEILREQGVRARDPHKDLRLESNIAIDFGTSSTVVAYEDINGRPLLLRIGVDDFYEAVTPEHYENPTILEFLDLNSLLEHWNEIAQQPLVSWGEVRCSHEALHNLRNNDSDPEIVASILNKLKQWALREAKDEPIRITDQINEFEYQLSSLSPKNPVKGKPLEVNHDDPLDPIELYAWFLGLNINWRQRGLFLKYYMTFPVSYPKEVKEKILASFRRGLLRSLPAALIEDQDIMDQFLVEERGSEPAAYVASSIKAHNVSATDEGTAYAVFDFGGGTTDFDYGYYRWSTDDEYDQYGIEEVFEHFGANGDNFLGGENLLENMAYIVFKHNIDLCRQHKIAFTKPLDADSFAGSEMLIDKTQAARTNTLILTSKLRPFWEQGIINNTGVESITLINRLGEKVTCELTLPIDELTSYLNQRILQGLRNFFAAMKEAFQERSANLIHILLAGNSSKSERVQALFEAVIHPTQEDENLLEEDKTTIEYQDLIDEYLDDADIQACAQLLPSIFQNSIPEFEIHRPLEADLADSSIPTAKTGVALGILRLCPGSGVEVINHTVEESEGEAPFPYYVGRARRGKFQVMINRNTPYNKWYELGVVPKEGIFNFLFTQSNLALGDQLEVGHSELYPRRVTFPASYAGQKVYASAITPTTLVVGCSDVEGNISEKYLNTTIEVSLLN
ncbi:hypothetical protein B9T19_07625 [Ignatzschineria sp. F8392]|uniref:hypothetical protein n=1 Tax=Ignatzschineria sp. F8392 TaxID=1980117 RepID=UPI000B98E653|nr:hypothetical protein [Ignatzschineria sp. F8392]OYQ78708.1 hypothetical protein B9T19_07625 [Ignatzschineria sp. F8392]